MRNRQPVESNGVISWDSAFDEVQRIGKKIRTLNDELKASKAQLVVTKQEHEQAEARFQAQLAELSAELQKKDEALQAAKEFEAESYRLKLYIARLGHDPDCDCQFCKINKATTRS